MDKIRELLARPAVGIALGFFVGLVIGWFGIGWGVWPVDWKDASAKELRQDLRVDYLKMAVESYARNPNDAQAVRRFAELGDKGLEALKAIQADSAINPVELEVFSHVVAAGMSTKPGTQNEATQQPGAKETPGSVKATTAPGASVAATPDKGNAETATSGLNLVYLLVIFCGLTLVIGGVLVYLLFIRPRMASSGSRDQPATEKVVVGAAEPGYDYSAAEQGEPIAQFMTTYTLGDDLYDDSFSIDSPNGEFLGECGVGVSDTIGVGDPKKVSAFEVWLFDKNDIQTVTKVLMSDHAYNDPETSQKLAAKGEPVLVAPGKHVILETATLQMEARIVDTSYGQGALPSSSFFERMTLELAVWPKNAG